MGIFGSVKPPIRRIINDVLADDELAEQVSYRKWKGQAFDSSIGHNVDTFDRTDGLAAVRLRHTVDSASASTNALVEVADLYFLFRFTDLPDGISLKDKILDLDATEFTIKSIDKVFGLATLITVNGS